MIKMNTLLTALTVAGAVAAAPARSSAQWTPTARREIDTTFYFSKIGTVLVGNGAETVWVTGWAQPPIRIKAHAEEGLKFEAASGRVVVETTTPRGEALIQVTVPRGVRVVARTNSGAITVKET